LSIFDSFVTTKESKNKHKYRDATLFKNTCKPRESKCEMTFDSFVTTKERL